MKSASLLLALLPSFSGAAPVTGTVSLLDGTPLSGAVVRVGTDSVTTPSAGSFQIARSAGLRGASTAAREVSRNLQVRGGRLILSWNGIDPAGRHAAVSAIPAISAARSLGITDTLMVFWKGKRLVALSLPSDTGSLSFRVDTAWSDDAGIPWNARVAYGSILDARDGKVYRTVEIGAQRWMAENLDYAGLGGAVGECFDSARTTCPSPGRLYSWSAAMGLDPVFDTTYWGGAASRGICPAGWHVPSGPEWTILVPEAVSIDTVEGGISQHIGYSLAGGLKLKAVVGWPLGGADSVGFRVVRSGMIAAGHGMEIRLPGYASFATSSENPTYQYGAVSQEFTDSSNVVNQININYKLSRKSLRCLQD
jgi:uncharacterized protein (TIGR02145 family)